MQANTHRLALQSYLEDVMRTGYPDKFPDLSGGSKYHVYYQPDENLKMTYPAIVYKKDDQPSQSADDLHYISNTRWLVTIIDRDPDSPLPAILSRRRTTRYRNTMKVSGLYHETYTTHH